MEVTCYYGVSRRKVAVWDFSFVSAMRISVDEAAVAVVLLKITLFSANNASNIACFREIKCILQHYHV